jgi:hypothetical protein
MQADGTSADASDSNLDLQSIGQYQIEDEPFREGQKAVSICSIERCLESTNRANEAISTRLSGCYRHSCLRLILRSALSVERAEINLDDLDE